VRALVGPGHTLSSRFPDFPFGDVERLCFVHRILLLPVGFSWPAVSAEQRSIRAASATTDRQQVDDQMTASEESDLATATRSCVGRKEDRC
jgi:hypothetical protein